MIQKIRNLDPVYHVLYCIFIVFLKYVYFVFANPSYSEVSVPMYSSQAIKSFVRPRPFVLTPLQS